MGILCVCGGRVAPSAHFDKLSVSLEGGIETRVLQVIFCLYVTSGLDTVWKERPALLDQRSTLDNKCNIRLWRFTDGGAGDQLIEQVNKCVCVAGVDACGE